MLTHFSDSDLDPGLPNQCRSMQIWIRNTCLWDDFCSVFGFLVIECTGSVLDPYVFVPPGYGSVIICTDPDPDLYINKQNNEEKT